MKIAFQMDPLENLKLATDSTWQLMLEAARRGKIYHYTPKELIWNNGELLAICSEVKINNQQYQLEEKKILNLEQMDVIFIRQDPPYDMAYLTTTYLLEKIANKVLLINNPRAIRDFPEKIAVLDFQDFHPASIVTYNLNEAKKFANNHDKVIIKPLYGFAGGDVFCASADDVNFTGIINNLIEIHNMPVIVQEFISLVSEGDKRIILVDGDPVGAFLRVPLKGDVRSNLACGGIAQKTELNERDLEICSALKDLLKNNGLFLVGIDIIAGYLTEINITSPTGLVQIKNFNNFNIAKEIFDRIDHAIIK